MSYLNFPRLTFAGQFQADPSTVNNDPNHFNNATFEPGFQKWGEGATNGWWNPEGTGSWRFVGCRITGVTYRDGTSTTDSAEDPVIGMSVADAGSRVAGKIVDLDSQQQTVSMLWGLTVRIMSGEKCPVRGEFEPVAFSDIWWAKQNPPTGAGSAAAVYQSVIDHLVWTDFPEIKSRYLDELKSESPDRLSIKFNVDLYCDDHTSPQFTLGRIVGSIGPSDGKEPRHFTVGRQLIPDLSVFNGMYLPSKNDIYMACALVDERNRQVVLDLGNSLRTNSTGKISESRVLTLAVKKGFQAYENLSPIDYRNENWYEQTGGIAGIELTNEQLTLAQNYPLAIMCENVPLIDEAPDYVRADQFVFRMNPGEEVSIDFYASHLGKLRSNQSIICRFQDSLINIMGQGSGVPPTSTPNILSFATEIVTDQSGKATLKVKAGDPENPRGFIDGQVYALWYYIKGLATANFSIDLSMNPPAVLPSTLSLIDPNNFISILVFDSVPQAVVKKPTWEDIQPTMQQYANLYPIMSKGIFNLAEQRIVDDNAEILRFVFSKEKTDPNYMPATRDLSRAKQKMIINYLDGVLKAKAPKENVTTRKS